MKKNNFKNGDILYAQQLNEIEDSIISLLNSELENNLNVQSNWDQNDSTKNDFIHNRPFWSTTNTKEWDGMSGEIVAELSNSHLLLSESLCNNPKQLIGSNIVFSDNLKNNYSGVIQYYIGSKAELDSIVDIFVDEVTLCWIDIGYMSSIADKYDFLYLYAIFKDTKKIITIGHYYSDKYLKIKGLLFSGGLYTFPNSIINDELGTIIKINYLSIFINDKYKSFFDKVDNVKVNVLKSNSLDVNMLSHFNTGDIILVYAASEDDIPNVLAT